MVRLSVCHLQSRSANDQLGVVSDGQARVALVPGCSWHVIQQAHFGVTAEHAGLDDREAEPTAWKQRQQRKKNQTNEQQAEEAETVTELVGLPPTCLEIIDALEVANEEVARDDNGGVSQHVDQEAEEPEIVPAVQQRQRLLGSHGGRGRQHAGEREPNPAGVQSSVTERGI